MAKKTVMTEKVQRPKIVSSEFTGYLDEMPQEAKDRLFERNPKAEQIFKNWVAPTQPEQIVE